MHKPIATLFLVVLSGCRVDFVEALLGPVDFSYGRDTGQTSTPDLEDSADASVDEVPDAGIPAVRSLPVADEPPPISENCRDIAPGESCITHDDACPEGFETEVAPGYLICHEIDECVLYINGRCDNQTKCTNTVGGRTCSPCPEGLVGTGETECADIDECALETNPCRPLADCINTFGSFYCTT